MSRLLVLCCVGAAFGAAVRVLRLTGVLADDGEYASIFMIGVGVTAALVGIVLADHLQHRRTLHPRH